MFYGSTTLATNFSPDPWQVKLIRLLLFFIPRANPDNEKLYPLVKKWSLELDDAGVPVREVGLDAKGRPLFIASAGRNFGFWTDSLRTFDRNELEIISADEFENLWHEAQSASPGKFPR